MLPLTKHSGLLWPKACWFCRHREGVLQEEPHNHNEHRQPYLPAAETPTRPIEPGMLHDDPGKLQKPRRKFWGEMRQLADMDCEVVLNSVVIKRLDAVGSEHSHRRIQSLRTNHRGKADVQTTG